jgi:glycosyltransferase involved in cell wall biosynthesis
VRLLFVGNCTRLKGIDYLIRAVALLGDLPLTLDVVGDIGFEPQYYESVRQLAKRLNVSDRIIFRGAVSHERLGVFYSAADIFTFPSLYEGFGIVLGEAMHAGLPIVTTRVGAVDEIVREGENAVVVPPSDSQALADAIKRLAMDPNKRVHFGQRSRELAKLLPTWKQTCDDIRHAINR